MSGFAEVSSGGTANATTVKGGELVVSAGGTATDMNVLSTGELYVDVTGDTYLTGTYKGKSIQVADGLASNVTIWYDRYMTVSDGWVASNTTLQANYSSACQYVRAGASAVGTIVSNGRMFVSADGYADSATVMSGFAEVSSGGTANATTVKGGYLEVSAGGTATDMNVLSTGELYVDVTGDTYLTGTYKGKSIQVADGLASNVTIWYDRYMTVSDGWVASNTTLHANYSSACQYVREGGSAVGTVVSNGRMFVSADGYADSATIISGFAEVSSGGTANATTVKGGYLEVSAGGTATDMNVLNAGELYVDVTGDTYLTGTYKGKSIQVADGLASNVTIWYDRYMTVSDGWVASNTTLHANYSSACQYVREGGSAVGTIVSNGRMFVSSGGYASSATLISGFVVVSSNGEAYATIVKGGEMVVSNGGWANSTLMSNGEMAISNGGVANATTISKGVMTVSSGGLAQSTVNANGGSVYVARGGRVNSTVVNSGYLYLSSGGTAQNTTIDSKGNFIVFTSGVLLGAVVLGGKMTLSGAISATSANIIFDVARRKASDAALINDVSKITGGTYSITVAADQADGQYKLAGGASAFNKNVTLTVKDTNLSTRLATGGTMTVGGKEYTLSVVSGNLCLEVETIEVPAPTNLSCNSTMLSWSAVEGVSGYVVEYSQDNFATSISVETETVGMAHLNLPSGTWQWRVKATEGEEWAVGNNITVSSSGTSPTVVSATADGVKDVFFVKALGTWDSTYRARHMGVHNGWAGTGEIVVFGRENRFGDIFQGSRDENVLMLTDDANGDALFIDDVFTASVNDFGKTQARLASIKEIRAGAGNDIVDLTSERFDYTGGGLSIRGGLGDDTIWANSGNNTLFGDAGNDRLVGAGGNDVIVGGLGNDSMHGGGGDDIFAFGGAWGDDSVEQLSGGKVTLWFDSGSAANWNASTLTYNDGDKSVKVSGVAAGSVTLKFGDDGSAQYASLRAAGAFTEFTDERIFDSRTRGMLA